MSQQLQPQQAQQQQQSQRQQQPQQRRQQQRQPGQAPAQGPMFPTRNYLDQDVRATTVQELNQLLADTTVLVTHAKFAHWNVRGMQFYGLHELFEELAETLDEHTDLIAERATALGGLATGTVRTAAATSRVPELPAQPVTGPQCIDLLAERLAVHDTNLCQAIERASQRGDPDTADLLNEVSRDVSKYLWFLEAHVQAQPVGATQQTGQWSQQGSL